MLIEEEKEEEIVDAFLFCFFFFCFFCFVLLPQVSSGPLAVLLLLQRFDADDDGKIVCACSAVVSWAAMCFLPSSFAYFFHALMKGDTSRRHVLTAAVLPTSSGPQDVRS